MTGIRTITEEDLPSIRKLIEQLAVDLGEVFEISKEKALEHYLAMQEHPEVYRSFVYCMDDQVIGFLSLVLYRSFFHRKGTALVNELVVKKEFRNRQIGKAMLEHAFSVATEAGMDELEVGVMKENTRALAFYRQNGFDEEYLLLGKEFSVSNKASI